MSRTKRNEFWSYCALRKPRTFNELRQNTSLIADVAIGDIPYKVSGMNRSHRFIPTHWDDIVISSYYESDFKNPNLSNEPCQEVANDFQEHVFISLNDI